MTRAAIYVRISQDREGAGLGVARQEEDCRALCERKGWTVADIYVDNDTSAYSGTPRKAWERLIADAKAGAIEAVACWHIDRLTRSPRELEDVIDLAEGLGLQLGTATGEVDLGTPTGKLVARMLGAAARHEAEHKAERQRREHKQRAEAGKFAGGGHRPFGYTRVYAGEPPNRKVLCDEINEAEAEVVRECADRVLAGESLSSICRDLRVRDIHTTAGNYFLPTTLRDMLCSARISGRREHIPVDSYRGKARPLVGEIVSETAVWPKIIEPEQSDQIRAMLTRPERLKGSPANGRKYLLSGILRCALCGAGMVGRPRSGVPRYVCPNVPGGKSCGRLATNTAKTDEHVTEMVLIALRSADLVRRLREGDGHDQALGRRLREIEERLEELAAAWAEGDITRAEWKAAREPLVRQVERDRDALARATRTTALDGFAGSATEQIGRWEAMNVSQQRAVIASVVDRIEVGSADPRKRWDPDRFMIIWRDHHSDE